MSHIKLQFKGLLCLYMKLYSFNHFYRKRSKAISDLMHPGHNLVYTLGFMSHAPIQLSQVLKRLKGHTCIPACSSSNKPPHTSILQELRNPSKYLS